ncbi:hypothetical protein K432DRAFT_137708 [Lepidopterella palustris CBS 459.81]|uniref:Uncharacterized protein n=1 Tax=Lepidopterella palustris CBS 459.81 TaxID=1314670 RepID=A0A8E2EHS5_9PEZI|nr:hypothetical protein K432DRAFT_137708 [Lepidopterella palustris CBS 459.81]
MEEVNNIWKVNGNHQATPPGAKVNPRVSAISKSTLAVIRALYEEFSARMLLGHVLINAEAGDAAYCSLQVSI